MVTARSERGAQQRRGRKPAPRARVSTIPSRVDERTEILMEYAPECLPPKEDRRRRNSAESKFVAYFGDALEPVSRRVRKGWTATIDPETKEHVTHNGDPLYTMSREEYQRTVIEPPANESREIIRDCLLGEDEMAVSAGATTEDELGVVEFEDTDEGV